MKAGIDLAGVESVELVDKCLVHEPVERKLISGGQTIEYNTSVKYIYVCPPLINFLSIRRIGTYPQIQRSNRSFKNAIIDFVCALKHLSLQRRSYSLFTG